MMFFPEKDRECIVGSGSISVGFFRQSRLSHQGWEHQNPWFVYQSCFNQVRGRGKRGMSFTMPRERNVLMTVPKMRSRAMFVILEPGRLQERRAGGSGVPKNRGGAIEG